MNIVWSLVHRWRRWKWRRQATVIEGDYWPEFGEVVENTWIKGDLHIAQPYVVIRNSEAKSVRIHLKDPS